MPRATAPMPSGDTKRRGRPPVAPEERLSTRLFVLVSPADREELDAWAEREGRPLTELVRAVALRAAKRHR